MSPVSSARQRVTSDDMLALWRDYRTTADAVVRDRLILTLAPLVKHIVYKKAREIPAHLEIEDLISCGLEALMHCIDRFDPDRGSSLEQFVWTRVHGAVLDELRRLDWAPRSVRRWERDINRAAETFNVLHRRKPSIEELADALAIDPQTLCRRRAEITRSDLTSLNTLVSGDDNLTVERLDTIASDDVRADPEHAAGITEAKDRFRAAFGGLSKREREVAVLMYVKNLKLHEVGAVLGVSESRVCQIHTEMKRKLRHQLSDDTQLMRLVA